MLEGVKAIKDEFTVRSNIQTLCHHTKMSGMFKTVVTITTISPSSLNHSEAACLQILLWSTGTQNCISYYSLLKWSQRFQPLMYRMGSLEASKSALLRPSLCSWHSSHSKLQHGGAILEVRVATAVAFRPEMCAILKQSQLGQRRTSWQCPYVQSGFAKRLANPTVCLPGSCCRSCLWTSASAEEKGGSRGTCPSAAAHKYKKEEMTTCEKGQH